ncbi:hypothetical protein EJB05_36927, partial [Eragrostis curvula]
MMCWRTPSGKEFMLLLPRQPATGGNGFLPSPPLWHTGDLWGKKRTKMGEGGLHVTATSPYCRRLRPWSVGSGGWRASRTSKISTCKGLRTMSIMVIWALWRERNVHVFEAKEKTLDRLVSEIKDETELWCAAGAKNLAELVVQMLIE